MDGKVNKNIRCLFLTTMLLFAGCSSEVGEHFRDVADYDSVRSRFPSIAVRYFPVVAPANAKMYGYFVPMQGGNGLELSVVFEPSEFDSLLAETETKEYDSAIGVDLDDPETLMRGQSSPLISLGEGDPKTLSLTDRIFTIQNGPPIDCGMIFRTETRTVVYWVYYDP